MEKEHNNLPAYVLENSWEQELNYKLWSTKSSRFNASNRLKDKALFSNLSLAFLSSYLIIINLIPAFFNNLNIDANVIGFFTTAISILLLIYSQIESSNEYKLNAHIFHTCALDLGDLYNELRIAKEISIEEEKRKKLIMISEKYSDILHRYDNHSPIDFDMFKANKPEYHKLDKVYTYGIYIKYFIIVKFQYYLLMTMPPLLFSFVLLNYSK
ncbi:MAG: SLATT domain-containing protein [Sulfurimonas sp.]|nr:SLATT domain-containing protein [Sulfurimonas sp.]